MPSASQNICPSDNVVIHKEEDSFDTHHRYQTLQCRSFWKAGSYDVISTPSHTPHENLESSDFDHARIHPRFLHSNATSHKWAFGAIAELLDNTVDEVCNGATFVKVDKVNNMKDNSSALLFHDDGGGMDPEGLRQCMSLGFSSKKTNLTIGQYGNGFKTSTMRLGADAIVFTRANRGTGATQSIGLLSYTFLRRTLKDDIIVPMVDFKMIEDHAYPIIHSSQDDWNNNLKVILEWSPFTSKEELMLQFGDMGSHGTKVLVYNLWYNDDGLLELDFDDDDNDILLRDRANNTGSISNEKKQIIHAHISYTLQYSLRAYASILYLRKFTNFCIILRGKPVQQLDIADELKFLKVTTYRPHVRMDSRDASVQITIGFAKEAPILGMYGINVYHKNRLIMPFWKVFQEGSNRGKCVVGLLEANFIEPAHDKQDFERSPVFMRLETKLKQMVVEFWTGHCHLIGYQSPCTKIRNMQKESAAKSSFVPTCVTPQEFPVTGLSAYLQQKFPVEKPVMPHVQPEVGPATVNSMESSVSGDYSAEDIAPVETSTDIGKLSEENIQLFMRREELRHKEIELKQIIDKVELELEVARKKCSRLASDLEIQRKQHVVEQ